jgi:hypothetical protein
MPECWNAETLLNEEMKKKKDESVEPTLLTNPEKLQ